MTCVEERDISVTQMIELVDKNSKTIYYNSILYYNIYCNSIQEGRAKAKIY